MKTLLALITLALLLTSCGDYKPFDAGIKKIQAEESLNRFERQRLELNKFAEYYNSLTPEQQDSIKTLRRTLKGL